MEKFARRTEFLKISPIRMMTRLVQESGAINLAQGLGELPTFQPAIDAAIEAMRNQKNRYTFPEGTADLRSVVLKKMSDDYGLDTSSLDVLVGVGSSGVFADISLSLFEEGDEILVIEPFYGYHLYGIQLSGARPVFCPTEPPGFSVTAELLDRYKTPNTRAVVFCNPSNPSGKVYAREELTTIAQWIQKNDLIAITDEIYEYIIFDGKKHICLATLPGMKERTLTVSGFSKTFSMTGWRLGTVVGPKPVIEKLTLMNDALCVCAPTPLQHGVAAAWKQFDAGEKRSLAEEYRRKREILMEALAGTVLTAIKPSGAYYLLADVSSLNVKTCEEAVMKILREANVAVVSGSAFFNSPLKNRYVRFCFAKSDENLVQASRQLVEAFRR